MTRTGFSYSEIPGSKLAWQLPEAYRSLLRPSSASSAKASTGCPLQLAETMLALAMEFSRDAASRWLAPAGRCPVVRAERLEGSAPVALRPAALKAAQSAHIRIVRPARPVITPDRSANAAGVPPAEGRRHRGDEPVIHRSWTVLHAAECCAGRHQAP